MTARECMARDIAEAFRNGTCYQCGIDGYNIRVELGIITAKKSKFKASFMIAKRDDVTGEIVLGKHALAFEWIRKALLPEQHRETIDDLWGEL